MSISKYKKFVPQLWRGAVKNLFHRILNPEKSQLKRTAEFWDHHQTADSSEYWMNIKQVRRSILTRLTGSPDLSWYTQQINDREGTFGQVLAFGDGFGMIGEAYVLKKKVSGVINLNISSGEAQRFIKIMESVEMQVPYRNVMADGNCFDFSTLGLFDTIIDVGAFHHLEKFEQAFPRLNQVLKPDGLMYVDEYVGPSRFHFNQKVIDLINEQLEKLPDCLILNRKKVSTDDFIQLWQNGLDHSEGIRSGELDAALREHFKLLKYDYAGGTFLQPFFITSQLRPCRLNIPNWLQLPEGQSAAEYLVKMEDDLIQSQELTSDYGYYVFTHKP